ncbi:hypothetical protein EJ08DRAFT_581144 [Tothia fuscella]|uniref:Multicopper oxidase n=1 Tax=Tothia fuscella TaxID=1048955 RepID=A0A9P4P0E7_9PEZI|nr:hypothetical protein EJ08DRAFT_581144 [Tothia fuscella]
MYPIAEAKDLETGTKPASPLKNTTIAPFQVQAYSKETSTPWLTRILFVICVALTLAIAGLGLGLGLKLQQDKTEIARLRSLNTTGDSNRNFNYSSFYGIPDILPVVSEALLVNQTELDMRTQFQISNVTSTRFYVFNITQALASPDGFQKPMILINNQSPGPLIEANSGDTIQVLVNNHMANWSTTIHWHGIDQKNSNRMDGVAAVTQCGIPPGQSFKYEFNTTGERGTFWYHSHLSMQYTDGLFGPIVIHDPKEQIPKVDEEKIIFMGDWYHTYSSVLLASYLNPTSQWANESGVEPLPDNILLNGRNKYNCSVQSTTYPPNKTAEHCSGGSLYKTEVKSGGAHRFRLINHSSFLSFWFSIDNHTMEIVEIDGTEIEPISFRGVNVNIGQRYSIIIHANQTVGNYNMRATLPTSCFLPFAPYNSSGLDSSGYEVVGILSYDHTDFDKPTIGVKGNVTNPYGASTNPFNNLVWNGCDDMPFNMTFPMRKKEEFKATPSNTHYIQYAFSQAQNVNRIFVNKTTWAPIENNATIWKASEIKPSNSYISLGNALNQQIYTNNDATSANELVINSLDAMEHPWHLHGHSFQIVGWGPSLFSSENTYWNYENPMRRDTVTVPANSHIVIRWENDNPGIWAMHRHVAWHVEGGMFFQFAERLSNLQKLLDGMDTVAK